MFAVALVGWGAPIAVIGLAPTVAIAVAAMLVVGTGNALLDIAGFTLLQRAIPNVERAAVFAVMEGVAGIGVAVGGLLVPLLVEVAGVRGAFLATGAILPVVALIGWSRVRRIDDESVVPERQARVLRSDPLFRTLPLAALERLAEDSRPVSFAEGELVMREGEVGDRYYVLASGSVEVGQQGRVLRRCGPGEGIGKIALLRSVPRTATVTALEPTEAIALGSAAFLAAVRGYEPSTAPADSILALRAGSDHTD